MNFFSMSCFISFLFFTSVDKCVFDVVYFIYISSGRKLKTKQKKHENRKIKTSNRVTTVNLFVKSGNDHTYVMCENDIKKKQSSIMPEFIAKWWGRKNRKFYFIKNFDVTLTSTSFINTFATLWVENLKVSKKKKKISRSSIGSLITFIVCMVRVDLFEFFYEREKFSSKFSMTLFFIFFLFWSFILVVYLE